MFKNFFSLTFFIVLLTLQGCGGGGGGSGAVSSQNTGAFTTSVLKDSQIENIYYKCGENVSNPDTGYTNSKGEFTHRQGCGEIVFSVGGLNIGSIGADDIPLDKTVYPTDLAKTTRTDTNNEKVTQIIRVLQSLDEDNDPSNGIQLDAAAHNTLKHENKSLTTDTFSEDELSATVTKTGKTLIDKDTAIAHFEETLREDFNSSVDTVPPPKPKLSEESELFSYGKDLAITINGEPGSKIFLNDSDTNITIAQDRTALVNLPTNDDPKQYYEFNITLQDSANHKSDILTIEINKDSTPPVFNLSSPKKIDENSNNLTHSLTASDDTTLSYILSGTDKDFFTINSSTGDITFNSSPDYDTKQRYDINITATDFFNNSTTVPFAFEIVNKPEIAPTLNNTVLDVNENSTDETEVGNIDIASVGDTDIYRIDLTGNGSQKFRSDANGTLFVVVPDGLTPNENLDFETTQSYTITATAYNGITDIYNTELASNEANITINLNDMYDVLPDLEETTLSISEHGTAGSSLGQVSINSPGDSNITGFAITSGSSYFDINSSGYITLNASNVLDYETNTQYILQVTATNEYGTCAPVAMTIDIVNIEEKPILSDFIGTIEENSEDNSSVGTINIADIGDNTPTTFELSGTGEGNFTINEDAQILVSSSASLDYEHTQEYTLQARAENSIDWSEWVDINITIIDVADVAPTLQNLDADVDENSIKDTLVGSITLDEGDRNITSIQLSGSGNENFYANTLGDIFVAQDVLDYEHTNEYNLTAIATNAAGDSNEANISIAINNIQEVPILEDFSTTIDENSANGTVVGPIAVLDYGDDDITDFNLTGTNSDHFDINSSGILTVAQSPNYEDISSYSLNVSAQNSIGWSTNKVVTITINDLPDVVPVLQDLNTSVDENSNEGVIVGSIPISTTGDRNITSIDLNGTGKENFLVSTTGEITVAAGGTIDFETSQEYNLTAIAHNDAGQSNSSTIKIDIKDLADELAQIEDFSGNIDENATSGTLIGDVNVSFAGDWNVSAFDLAGIGNENFDIDSNGKITLSASSALDYESTSSYTLQVTATNDTGVSLPASATIAINNIPEVPILSDFTGYVNERALKNTVVGKVSIADKGDTTPSSFALSCDGNFTIDGFGVIKVADGADLNSSEISQYNFEVNATNTVGVSENISATISVEPSYYLDTNETYNVFDYNEDTLYLAQRNNGLTIVDAHNQDQLSITGHYTSNDTTKDVTVYLNFAYLADDLNGIEIVNISTKSDPLFEKVIDTPGAANRVVLDSTRRYLYVADGPLGVQIIDLEATDDNYILGAFENSTEGNSNGITIYDATTLFVANGKDGMVVLDITNMNNPVQIGILDTSGNANEIVFKGDYAYIADGSSGVHVVNIADITNPELIHTYPVNDSANSIEAYENYLFIGDNEQGLLVLDISSPELPKFKGQYSITGGKARGLKYFKSHVFIGTQGLDTLKLTLE